MTFQTSAHHCRLVVTDENEEGTGHLTTDPPQGLHAKFCFQGNLHILLGRLLYFHLLPSAVKVNPRLMGSGCMRANTEATSHVKHSECGWSTLRGVVSVKYTLDFKTDTKKGAE